MGGYYHTIKVVRGGGLRMDFNEFQFQNFNQSILTIHFSSKNIDCVIPHLKIKRSTFKSKGNQESGENLFPSDYKTILKLKWFEGLTI